MTRSNEMRDIKGIQEHPRGGSTELYKASLPLKLEIQYFGELRISEVASDDLPAPQASILEETIIRKSSGHKNVVAIVKVISMEDSPRQGRCCQQHHCRLDVSNMLSIDAKSGKGRPVSGDLQAEKGAGPSAPAVSGLFRDGDRTVGKWYTIRPNCRQHVPKTMVRWRSVPDMAPDEPDCPETHGRTVDDFSQTEEMTTEPTRKRQRNSRSRFKRLKRASLRILMNCTKCCI